MKPGRVALLLCLLPVASWGACNAMVVGNDYIISGCGFGSQAGQLYLSGAITGGRINLVVKQWSDTQIEAAVQPGSKFSRPHFDY